MLLLLLLLLPHSQSQQPLLTPPTPTPTSSPGVVSDVALHVLAFTPDAGDTVARSAEPSARIEGGGAVSRDAFELKLLAEAYGAEGLSAGAAHHLLSAAALAGDVGTPSFQTPRAPLALRGKSGPPRTFFHASLSFHV